MMRLFIWGITALMVASEEPDYVPTSHEKARVSKRILLIFYEFFLNFPALIKYRQLAFVVQLKTP